VGLITGSKGPETKYFPLKHVSLFLFWEIEGYSMREIAKKLKILYNAVYYPLHRTA
jgi:predicted DNA-binding protein YlxM (UPF0122 family)